MHPGEEEGDAAEAGIGRPVADGLDRWVDLEVVQGRGAPVGAEILAAEAALAEEVLVTHGKKIYN